MKFEGANERQNRSVLVVMPWCLMDDLCKAAAEGMAPQLRQVALNSLEVPFQFNVL